VAAVMF